MDAVEAAVRHDEDVITRHQRLVQRGDELIDAGGDTRALTEGCDGAGYIPLHTRPLIHPHMVGACQ